jgi:hypothetical protein
VIRTSVVTAAFALGLVLVVVLAIVDRGEHHELGSGQRVIAGDTTSTAPTLIPPATATTTTEGFERSTTSGPATEVSTYRPARVEPPWDALAECESGGRWDIYNPPHEGGLQFHHATWDAYKLDGYPADAHLATREQQIAVAELVLGDQGWEAWPTCSRKLGLR